MSNAREKSQQFIPNVGEDGRYAVLRTSKTEERRPLANRVLVLRRDRSA